MIALLGGTSRGLVSGSPVRAAALSGERPWTSLKTIPAGRRREIPLTLERAPWPIRHAFGHYGAYREGVGALVSKLRSTFDPDPTFAVALEGVEHE